MKKLLILFFLLTTFAGFSQDTTITIGSINGGLTTEENCFLALAAQQITINANTVIELRDDIAGVSVNNGIDYNNTTFRSTLKKDKTYKLQAYTRHFGSTSNTAANYRWYDVTNGTFIGQGNQIASLNSPTNDGEQSVASAIITPTTDIEVELRCSVVSAPNQGLRNDATYATIEKISELLFGSSGLSSINQHLLPEADSVYDLGSATKRWRDLYVTSGTIYLGSETLSIDSTGALSFSGAGGISTPSSPPQWLDIQRKSSTNDQTGIDEGTDIILDSVNGNITYNAVTGVASLKVGKVYALWGTFAAFSISTNETVAIQWVKASDNTPLYEGHETRLRPQSSNSNGNNQPTIKLIYKPTVDIDVKLRCTEYTGAPDTFTLYWDRSFATITEIR